MANDKKGSRNIPENIFFLSFGILFTLAGIEACLNGEISLGITALIPGITGNYGFAINTGAVAHLKKGVRKVYSNILNLKKSLSNKIKMFMSKFPSKLKTTEETLKEKASVKLTNIKEDFEPFITKRMFLATIKRDIEDILSVKYPGYEEDIQKLRSLIEDVFTSQEVQGKSPVLISKSSSIYQRLIELENSLHNKKDTKFIQSEKEIMLAQIDSLIEQANLNINALNMENTNLKM